MKLLSIRLKNFRQHTDTLIEFKDGITGIIGVNGAGKSTIIEGIIFALYGAKKIRGRSDEIRTYGINSKELTFCELCFIHDEQVYLVYRDLNSARLQLGTQILAEGQKVVSDRIEQLLKMTYDEFAAAYCTEQKSLEFLSVRHGATEREKFIAEMLGYDKIEKIQELIRQDRRIIKNEIAGLEATLGAREKLAEKLENEKSELKKLKNAELELIKIQQIRSKEEQHAGEALQALQQNLAPFMELKDKIRQSEVRAEENNRRAAQLNQKADVIKNKLSGLLAELQISSAEEAVFLTEKLEKDILVQQHKLSELTNTKSEHEGNWQSRLNKMRADYEIHKARVSEIKGRITDILKLKESGSCPTCGQKLGEEFKRIRDFLKQELSVAQENFDVISGELKSISSEPKEISEIKEAIKQISLAINSSQQSLKSLQSLQVEINDSLRINVEQKDLQKELAEINAQLARHKSKIAEIQFSEEEYSKARTLFETQEKMLNLARLQKVEHDGRLREQEAMLRRTQEELVRYDEQVQILTQKKKQQSSLSDADTILTEFRSALNAAIRPRLAEIASEYLADLSDGRYSSVQITEDFSPAVYENGFMKNVLSGGEEDLLNVCLRLSLSTLIAERSGHTFSLLLMDEIFGSLDENRRQNVLNLLERLQNRFEQIVLITHLDDIKDSVRHLIYINYDEASGSLNTGSSLLKDDLAVNI